MINRDLAPTITKLTTVNIPNSEIHTSHNGIKFHFLKGNGDFVRIDVHFYAGKAFQEQFLVSAFTNAMLREGTKYHSSCELAEKLDFYGAWLNAGASTEKASLTLYSLQKFLPNTLKILEEIMKYPIFPENEFLTLKKQKKQSYLLSQEKVEIISEQEFFKRVYGPKSKYSATAELNDYESIQREWIEEFYNHFYTVAPSDVFVMGNLSQEEVKKIEAIFESYPPLKNVPKDSSLYHFSPQLEEEIVIKKENSVQAAINIGCQLFSRKHPDFHKFTLLNTVLGGYFGSRLMSNIREEKGYTYGIQSSVYTNLETGHIQISTQTANEYIDSVVAEIYKELKRLCKELIPKDELDIVKNYMIGSMARTLDGDFSRAGFYISVNNYKMEIEEYVNTKLEVINNTTSEELKTLAQKYFEGKRMHQVIVG